MSREKPADFDPGRRGLLRMGAVLFAGMVLGDSLHRAGADSMPLLSPPDLKGFRALDPGAPRALAFVNTHTGETLETAFWRDGTYQPDALHEIDRILRDHRTGDVKTIDQNLLEILHTLRNGIGSDEPYHVISGYRSPATNAELRRQGHGVASGSLHMEGRAIDVRLPGTRLTALRDAARTLARGGIGFYPSPDFVHIDTGRVREW